MINLRKTIGLFPSLVILLYSLVHIDESKADFVALPHCGQNFWMTFSTRVVRNSIDGGGSLCSTVPNWTWPWCCCISNQILWCPITQGCKGLPDFLVTAFFVRLFCASASKTSFRSAKEKKRNKLLLFMCCCWILLSLCSSSLLSFWACLSFQRLDSLDLLPSSDVKLAWRWWLRLKMQRAKGWVAQDTSLASWEHRTRKSLYIKGICLLLQIDPQPGYSRTKGAYLPTTTSQRQMAFVPGKYFMPTSGQFRLSTFVFQVLPAHQLQKVSNGGAMGKLEKP